MIWDVLSSTSHASRRKGIAAGNKRDRMRGGDVAMKASSSSVLWYRQEERQKAAPYS
jgi:hypothetical protein